MKKKIVIAIVAVFVLIASSFTIPECVGFEQFKRGANYVMTYYKSDGSVESTVECTVEKVNSLSDKTIADIFSVVRDPNGKQKDTINYQITCTGSSYFMDSKGLAISSITHESQGFSSYEISGDMMEYPIGIRDSQELAGSKMFITSYTAGQAGMVTAVTIKNRKCEKIESKTTTAGTWSCSKVTYDMVVQIKSEGMTIPGKTLNVIEWFSNSVGSVRTETFSKGKLVSYTELTKFTKAN